MASVGTPTFFRAFRGVLRARLPFSTFLLIRFDPGAPPRLLESWLAPGAVRAAALKDYIENTYPFDPFYQHGAVPKGGALYRLPDIAPDRFFSSEYYLEYYRSTGLCDEVGLLAPLGGGARSHLSLSRSERQGRYKTREMRCLRHHAPLLLELLTQHCAVAAARPSGARGDGAGVPPLAELIQYHTAETAGAHLTPRECQIAALVLQGHSNRSAGALLRISGETCKVHRRNLYRKLQISSQHDLFGLLKHLL